MTIRVPLKDTRREITEMALDRNLFRNTPEWQRGFGRCRHLVGIHCACSRSCVNPGLVDNQPIHDNHCVIAIAGIDTVKERLTVVPDGVNNEIIRRDTVYIQRPDSTTR